MVSDPSAVADPARDFPLSPAPSVETAVLAGGCFWCVEAVYRQIDGVTEVRSGYAGGTRETANYRAVCSGRTDHAEAVEIQFDSSKTTFGRLLKIFFSVAHDPTQLDRQGNDRGRQYRSAIFYRDDEQRAIAEAYIQQLDRARIFPQPIVTRLEPLDAFYIAEDYHQDYAARNPDQPYIVYVAAPKVEQTRKYFCSLK
ncbi:MAG TPA: peptide-methionine (S)-S-oxide reductase MsrA [Terriglobia bacterium]|nr:peptide-methionine (S)-S-oxide reductase MsrA [Terriglobia bacterium]